MGFSDEKVFCTIFKDVYGITLRIDVGTDLGSLDGSFNDFNGGKLEGLFLLYSMNSTGGKFLDTLFGITDGITPRLDIGTDMGSLDRSIDGSDIGKLEGLFLVYGQGSIDGKLFGSDEVIKLRCTNSKVLVTILRNLDDITLGVDAGTDMGSLIWFLDVYNNGKLEGFLIGVSLRSSGGKLFGSD